MKIIVFHRAFMQKKILSKNNTGDNEFSAEETAQRAEGQNEQKFVQTHPKGLSNFKYTIKNREKSFILSFSAKYEDTTDVKDNVVVSTAKWTQFGLFYNFTTGKVDVNDLSVIGTALLNQDNYIARVLNTDSETLIYLRGRIPDITGYKNIVVRDGQNSATAFSAYSSKAKHFLEGTIERKNSLAQVDIFKYLCLLETQVDLLTKIVIEKGLIDNKELKSILQDAIDCSACMRSASTTLRKRIQYKKQIQFCQEFC